MDLQNFGIKVMDSAETLANAAGIPVGAYYCWGLQIALIAARPWRKRTFTAVELWSNLVRDGPLWRLRAHAYENKQKRYQSGLVPAKLVPYLNTYITEHRVALCELSGYSGDALWLNIEGRPMTPQQLLKALTRLTEAEFGERITVHAVRKIAATTMAIHNPRNVHHNQGILGHAHYDTGEQCYAMAGAVHAHSELDATIEHLSRQVKERRRLSRRGKD